MRGTLRPGEPVTIEARLSATADAPSGTASLSILDTGSDAGEPGLVASWNGGLAKRQAAAPMVRTVTFDRAGYYRVVLRTNAPTQDPTVRAADTVVSDDDIAIAHLLITKEGGRIDQEFDPNASKGFGAGSFLYGSFGPWENAPGASESDPRDRKGLSSRQRPRKAPLVRFASRTASPPPALPLAIGPYHGLVRFRDQEVAGFPLVPAVGVEMVATCAYTLPDDPAYELQYEHVAVTTNASGNFTVNFSQAMCYPGYPTVAAVRYLDANSSVRGKGGDALGGSKLLVRNQTVDYRLGNDFAAPVFKDIALYAPQAFTKFGRTRGRVEVYVSTSDAGYGAAYSPGDDLIRTNHSKVLNEPGTFYTMHEYGHAFHNVAIEPPRNGPGCSSHTLGQVISLPCAFSEGFADFFSVWVAGAGLTNQTTAGYGFEDYTIEFNPFGAATADHSKDEGAVAAFFYDLVDGPADPNGFNNETGGDDDNVTWPGSYLASVIATCQHPLLNTSIDGIDEFIYCAEQNVNARTANPFGSWRTWLSFSEGATEPPGWSPAIVRAMWLKDLFNTGTLP